MCSVKCSGKLVTATALLLWRKRFEFCGENVFYNIKYLRCVRYCLNVLSDPSLSWPSLMGTASIKARTPQHPNILEYKRVA